MNSFIIQDFLIKEPKEIEEQSLAIIEKECESYDKIKEFSFEEKEIIKRLIHASTCFENIIYNIFFTKDSVHKIKELLKNKAYIITDTNMIKSGISNIYTDKYKNKVLCYVNSHKVKEDAKKQNITRSYLAVRMALIENKTKPIILACGNAPTFLYSAIKTIIDEKIDINNIAIIAFPVGFVNVVDSKNYTKDFLLHQSGNGIIINGRFGSSTLVVSCLHAIYKLIK